VYNSARTQLVSWPLPYSLPPPYTPSHHTSTAPTITPPQSVLSHLLGVRPSQEEVGHRCRLVRPVGVHAWRLTVQGLPDLHDAVPRHVEATRTGEQLAHLRAGIGHIWMERQETGVGPKSEAAESC
jgi:hypothetical protein